MIKRLLIANRGEIACRIMRTAKKLGIETVAVYSDADRKAMFVRMADKAYHIGPSASLQSYLNMEKILAVCQDAKVDAVHPGYGFLSENSKFMDLLDHNKIIFVGPKKHALEAMGDKINSKKIAKDAKVNTVPGFVGEVEATPEMIIKACKEVGYPVMIKASAGGGGKGMRIAWSDEEAVTGYRLSKAEAKSSFNDDRILIEKYIEEPRHIEFQILGDSQGNVVYLPERECSIQRRNQKVIEEAPSPFLDPETRRNMGEQAAMLAKAVQYQSSGTVEFLVDKHKKFYFLEMNTRLQMEHPITEAITGVDIVEEMIRVAEGKPLSFRQQDVKINGWAMESRVYAEDPYRGFLPSIGHLLKYQEPTAANIRVDTGVREGDEISMWYDPMISKMCCWAPTRPEVIELSKTALDTYVIRGLGHNAPFCRDVMKRQSFIEGKYSTKFIPIEYPKGFIPMPFSPKEKLELAAISSLMKEISRLNNITPQRTEFLGPYIVKIQGEYFAVYSENKKLMAVQVDLEGNPLAQAEEFTDLQVQWDGAAALITSKVGGKTVFSQFIEHTNTGYNMVHSAIPLKVNVYTPKEFEFVKHMPHAEEGVASGDVIAPMPGAVVAVSVKVGDQVNVGQELGILEAMKMRNVIKAEKTGKVKKVAVTVGQNVAIDDVLFEIS